MNGSSEKNVLVAGGAGYIGAQTAKHLRNNGYQPVVIDDLSRGHREFAQWGPLIQASLGNEAVLDETFRKYKPVAVIHLAAFAYVNESVSQPVKYYENNVSETLGLLKSMVQNKVDKFIFSSTCATYGIPSQIPIRETEAQNPINPYGWSKLMVEQILKDFSTAYKLRSVSLRYFNAAGADPDTEVGEWHDPEVHLIPLILDTALGKRDSISIFGSDYPTPDGTCVRDYIHVVDLAEAHLLALKYLEKGGEPLFCNLGCSRGYSVKEVVEAAEKITGRKIKTRMAPRREGDPPELVGDKALAKKILGWEPTHSELETIIRTAWKWHQKKFG